MSIRQRHCRVVVPRWIVIRLYVERVTRLLLGHMRQSVDEPSAIFGMKDEFTLSSSSQYNRQNCERIPFDGFDKSILKLFQLCGL